MNRIYISQVFFLLLLLSFWACQEDQIAPPPNPFDAIVYPDPPVAIPEPDSATIVGLHTYIFSVSCAVPGCHDGNFEPDFRTVQSAYSTLVFHPVVKNDAAGSYAHRIVPFHKEESWLYHRVTTSDQTLGRMPLYDNPLTAGQLKAIEDWIDTGAPDMFGNVSTFPNTQPRFTALAAFQDYSGIEVRVDTFRGDEPYNPFGAKQGLDLTIWFMIEDDSTDVSELENTKVAFASGVDNIFTFESELVLDAQFSTQAKVVPDYFGTGMPASFHWSVKVNTNDFPINDFTLFRLYSNDGNHAEDFEFPRDEHPIEFKSFMAIYVVP